MEKITDFYKVVQEKARFVKTNHKESFIVKDGDGKKVLFSCPHAVEQLREGSIKFAEPETGILGLLINEYFHYPLFLKTSNQDDDANYDPVSSYKDEMVNYVKEHGIRCVIDLHMLSPTRNVDVNIGTAAYHNISNRELVASVYNFFNKRGFLNITIDTPYGAFYPYTVSFYIHEKTGIDTIQIELNSNLLFSEDVNLYNTTKIKEVANVLIEIAGLLEDFYEKN